MTELSLLSLFAHAMGKVLVMNGFLEGFLLYGFFLVARAARVPTRITSRKVVSDGRRSSQQGDEGYAIAHESAALVYRPGLRPRRVGHANAQAHGEANDVLQVFRSTESSSGDGQLARLENRIHRSGATSPSRKVWRRA